MPTLDAFSSQIVKLVRAMPDEAILALVRAELGGAASGTAAPNGAPVRVPPAAVADEPGRRQPTAGRSSRRSSAS